jgi:hypothetical protein
MELKERRILWSVGSDLVDSDGDSKGIEDGDRAWSSLDKEPSVRIPF